MQRAPKPGLMLLLICVSALAPIARARGQAPSSAATPLAEQTFKNVQILRGIPVDEFMDTMGMFSAATGLNCAQCHALDQGSGWDAYALETPLKQTARRMLRMMNGINRDSFGGARVITCNTCHRGDQRPRAVPSLAIQYSAPAEDPNDVDSFPSSGLPSPDSIFEKYFQAIGGRARVESLTSIVANGTYAGYDTDHAKVPVEMFSRAPASKTTIVHTRLGDSVRVCDGVNAWISSPDRPLLLMPLSGGNLSGARVDALLAFPAALPQAFPRWRVALTSLADRDTYVVQAVPPGPQPPLNLYFDEESGLLMRALRFAETAVGRVPTQIDFGEYRDAGGVKLPFTITETWTDGQSTIELSGVRTNVAIDDARFRRPAPAVPFK